LLTQNPKLTPSASALGRWLHSWIQPSGAIHGFRSDAVWGDNPYRCGDFTAGHSTFASPLMLALATALNQRSNDRGMELLLQMLHFQTSSFQSDGQFEHTCFQMRDTGKPSLIHNVVPCAAMSAIAILLGGKLPADLLQRIDQAVRGVLAACDALHGPGVGDGSYAHPEYARIWATQLHMIAFNHGQWHEQVRRDLDHLIRGFHIRGCPDAESTGTLRVLKDPNWLEPAECYGLMIHALLLGAQRYEESAYLDEAHALARHVSRSAWTDGRGQRRVHRLWQRLNNRWTRVTQPMLIGGIGITLSAIAALGAMRPDDEMEQFLHEMDATYAHYQSPAGFFVSASGWGGEQDIIPSTAWQSHDLLYLLERHGAAEDFWNSFFAPQNHAAVVLGQTMTWIEADPHWAVRGYLTMHGLEVHGRKDRVNFGLHFPTRAGDGLQLGDDMLMPNEPRFIRIDEGIFYAGGRSDLWVRSTADRPYFGPALGWTEGILEQLEQE
jgi:hypothetical protein